MAIDHDKIREGVLGLGMVGTEDTGLLRTFGVILANNPVDYLVDRELEFINLLGGTALPLAEKVLIDAAQWCANATFGGIMDSSEWAGLVQPMIEKPADKLEGLFAVTNVLGWGHISDWDLNEETQELNFKVEHSYYVKNWIARYGKSDRPRCYMWTGVAGGYLDLMYGERVHDFIGEETECGCVTGKDECVFTAKKVKKKYSML
jgi:predicted hydrocarbon binding protein